MGIYSYTWKLHTHENNVNRGLAMVLLSDQPCQQLQRHHHIAVRKSEWCNAIRNYISCWELLNVLFPKSIYILQLCYEITLGTHFRRTSTTLHLIFDNFWSCFQRPCNSKANQWTVLVRSAYESMQRESFYVSVSQWLVWFKFIGSLFIQTVKCETYLTASCVLEYSDISDWAKTLKATDSRLWRCCSKMIAYMYIDITLSCFVELACNSIGKQRVYCSRKWKKITDFALIIAKVLKLTTWIYAQIIPIHTETQVNSQRTVWLCVDLLIYGR